MRRLVLAAVPLAFLVARQPATTELTEEQEAAIEQEVMQRQANIGNAFIALDVDPWLSAFTDEARRGSHEGATWVQSEGCLPDGSGYVRVELSGAVGYSIEWHNEDMECGGFNGALQFAGVPAGAGSQVDLTFDIEVEEAATGTDLPARVGITDRASERFFQTSEAGGCTVNVTEQSLIDENPAFRRYKLAANGSCTKTSLQYSGPGGAGASEITVGDFELVGLAVWQGPRR